MRRTITPGAIDRIVSLIPEEWLTEEGSGITPQERREVYREFMKTRLANSKIFTDHAIAARKQLC